MLHIQSPDTYQPERRYILSVLFNEFLGLDIQVECAERSDTKITLDDDKALLISDGLFATAESQWLQPSSLPKQPLKSWNLTVTSLNVTTISPHIPVIYGEDPDTPGFFSAAPQQIRLGLDIFGSTFFMLTRYEEVIKPDRDNHDRFPATASLAYQERFLDRPIVNEYLEILWGCLTRLWPQLQRKEHSFQIHVSHDVDIPFRYQFRSVTKTATHFARDIFRRHDPLKAVLTVKNWLQVKTGEPATDPYNTFDLIMDISDRIGLKNVFYFMTDQSHLANPAPYDIGHPLIRDLIRKVHRRGHEIGLHLSYHTYENSTQGKEEFGILKKVCEEEDIHQNIWGGRQHFLRWKTPATFQNGQDIGLNYDTTLGFADQAGFRCGVCYLYPVYNLETRQALALYEKPLIVMDVTFIDTGYMNLDLQEEQTVQTILQHKKRCQMFSGVFTLLWHNNYLAEPYQVDVYKKILGL